MNIDRSPCITESNVESYIRSLVKCSSGNKDYLVAHKIVTPDFDFNKDAGKIRDIARDCLRTVQSSSRTRKEKYTLTALIATALRGYSANFESASKNLASVLLSVNDAIESLNTRLPEVDEAWQKGFDEIKKAEGKEKEEEAQSRGEAEVNYRTHVLQFLELFDQKRDLQSRVDAVNKAKRSAEIYLKFLEKDRDKKLYDSIKEEYELLNKSAYLKLRQLYQSPD